MTYTLYTPPKPVGYWILPGGLGGTVMRFAAYSKPRWLTRTMMRLVFEWEWEDIK